MAWLDIANAYGSVHHELIQFSLAHYHAPAEFCRLMQSWYSDLSATISTDMWSTLPVPLSIGVYQGDPLSVVIFFTVMNTLSDTLKARSDLGFTLPSSSISIKHLLYADDVCLVSNSTAGCQYLLDLVQQWFECVLLKAKVPKCRSMAIQASTGRRVSPGLSIAGEVIPRVEDDTLRSWECQFGSIGTTAQPESPSSRIYSRCWPPLMRSLTRQQKLRLFKFGVCPSLSWPLLIEDFPISWLKKDLQPLPTKALKKWAGLARPLNISVLFLPVKRGGLTIPSLVGLYKRQQVSRMAQLFRSTDSGVRKAADLRILEKRRGQRLKFKPATFVHDLLPETQSQSRCALSGAAKTLISEEEADHQHQHLSQLSAKGEMARSWGDSSPQLWVKAMQGLPLEVMKFTINASINTLPTNANLHPWGKKDSDICWLGQQSRQSLPHVLNNCPIEMELRRYSRRHDEVLKVIGTCIKTSLPPNFTITIDHPSEPYVFPHHITPTDLRPNIVWWCDRQRELWLFELTISYETVVEEARGRKELSTKTCWMLGELQVTRPHSSHWKLGLVECLLFPTLTPSELPALFNQRDHYPLP